MNKIKNGLKQIWQSIRKPEMLILPGNLAFFLVMSLIPTISFFGIVASLFSLSTDLLTNSLKDFFPSNVVEILLPFIDGSTLEASVFLAIIGFFLASNGPDSLIIASNSLYKVQNQGYIGRRIKALVMTIFMVLLFAFILLFLAFGNLILKWLMGFEIIGTFIQNTYAIIIFLKISVAFIFIFLMIKILYTLAPDTKIKSKFVNRGALFSTIAILLVTSIYSYYVTNIANYDAIYGGLSNIIVLIFLIYLLSYIIVLGIAINSSYYNSRIEK